MEPENTKEHYTLTPESEAPCSPEGSDTVITTDSWLLNT